MVAAWTVAPVISTTTIGSMAKRWECGNSIRMLKRNQFGRRSDKTQQYRKQKQAVDKTDDYDGKQ